MPRPYFKNNKAKIREMIMVDHAGEFGAKRIYQGQLRYAKTHQEKLCIKNMLDQELEHLDFFDKKIQAGASRPTVLMPLWSVLGYSLGAVSSMLGNQTAMLVTQNIEEVIVKHYQDQIDYLALMDSKNPLLDKLKKFKKDEEEHIHISQPDKFDHSMFYNSLSLVIRVICRSAIFLSKRI